MADQVEDRLENHSWALVRGLGASGKTVLATQIALGRKFGDSPTYYLDLAAFSGEIDPLTALDTLTTRADDRVLFIIDNVHLNEDFSRTLFDHWQRFSNGSCLLMLGRWVSIGPDPKGLGRAFDDLESEAVILEAGPEDLAGVFRRLTMRFTPTANVLQPPEEVLRCWCVLFGGDLVALSAAVVRRFNQLTQGEWELRAEDAVDYIRETYLDRVADKERSNLMRISVLAKLEIDAPIEVVDSSGLRQSLRSGLVHRLERGKDKHVWFYLIHPGIGQLLLAAVRPPVNEISILTDVARRSPFWGAAIVPRLRTLGRDEELGSILRNLVKSRERALGIISGNFQYLRTITQELVRLSIMSEAEIDHLLAEGKPALISGLLRSPLDKLPWVLNYMERKLPQTHALILRSLTKTANLKTLSKIALSTPLGGLMLFLEHAERKLAYSAQFGHPFRSIPAACSGDSGRGRSEATLECFH